jgi:hypothetical protein
MKRTIQLLGWSLALLLLAVPSLLRAQTEVGLKMDVDKRDLQVGDALTLTLDFKQVGTSNSAVVQEPSIPTSENFDIQGDFSSNRVEMLGNNITAVSTTTYRMVATKAGTVQLGPAILIYQTPDGQRREMKSNIVTVNVTEKTGFSLFGKKSEPTPTASGAAPAAVPSPDDLRDIKGVPPDTFSWWTFLFWLVVLILIVGFIWRQFRKKPAGPAMVIPVGKAEELRKAWKALADEDLAPKEFALGLSNLVRECLQYRFGFTAVDYTTEEILKELSKIKLSDEEEKAVEKCLKTSDRVLYADGNLSGRETLRSACAVLLPKIKKD